MGRLLPMRFDLSYTIHGALNIVLEVVIPPLISFSLKSAGACHGHGTTCDYRFRDPESLIAFVDQHHMWKSNM